MSLHMLQLAPDLSGIMRWAAQNKLLHRLKNDDLGYAVHALLAAGFGAQAPKPWAMPPSPNQPAKLLGYTAHDEAALRDHLSSFADPTVCKLLGLTGLATKPMATSFATGRRLGFWVRARPTIRTDKAGERSATRERDAFLAAIEAAPAGQPVHRGAVYQTWLAMRFAAGGAVAEQMRIESYGRTLTLRRDRLRKLHAIEGPDVTFAGTLLVADSAAFAALLARGVGRHTTFGYGMLLLKPVS
jgi:CRISPR system Cascade subunit CasE